MSPRLDTILHLDTPDGFSFEQIYGYLSRSSNECLFDVRDGTVIRSIPVANEKPIVTIGPEPDGRLRIQLSEVETSKIPSIQNELLRYVAEWFDLERDLTAFYQMADHDPLLCGPAARFRGLRVVGVPDLYEAIGWAILGQQINLAFAYTLKRRLVETFGESAPDANGNRYWIFPTADKVALLKPSDLTGLHMTAKKAEYLIEAAKQIADGRLSKERLLAAGDSAEAERMLTRIRGIGPWTAHYVAMRCLRFPDAFPIQDVGLHLAIQKLLSSDRKPSVPEIRQFASAWSGWEAYATFYLWRVLY